MALSKEFIEQVKQKMLTDKKKIEEDLADFTIDTIKGSKTIFPDYGDHSGENASEVASFDNDVAVKNTLEKILRDIKSSLKRIEEGEYGICKYCGKEIGQGRLKVRPTSSACVECKSKFSK